MQGRWLIHEKRKYLLIFYTGWGMDEQPFLTMTSEKLDVYMLYDYRDLNLPESLVKIAAAYAEVNILAWSLGVWVAGKTAHTWPGTLNSTRAINGTLQPIHARHGISPAIFATTLAQLSPATLRVFYQNMFPTVSEGKSFLLQAPRRSWEELRMELAYLQTAISETGAVSWPRQLFSSVVVGKQDRIIPAAAQRRFWQTHPACVFQESGHFPFYQVKQWDAWLGHG